MNRESFIITLSLEEKTIIVITKLAIAPLSPSLRPHLSAQSSLFHPLSFVTLSLVLVSLCVCV